MLPEWHDHDDEPVVVKARYTGAMLNAGFYSRLREINPASSFSVNGWPADSGTGCTQSASRKNPATADSTAGR